MFTGIIREIGHIIERSPDGRRLRISAPAIVSGGLKRGDSVACNGICLTAAEFAENGFYADVVDETLSRTTASNWRKGDALNLEPALRLGDSLDGHMVAGHVDAVTKILATTPTPNGEEWQLALPPALAPMVAEKGGVCLDGASLTVTFVNKGAFGVALVPHTLERTIFSGKREGDMLNMEADLIARYLYRIYTAREQA